MHLRRRLAIVGLVLGIGELAAAPLAQAEPPAQPDASERAKAALDRARAATKEGNYEAAIVHYEQAQYHLPSAKLHFNIGVCHHRLLSVYEPGSEIYERHRAGAVASYDRYLQAAPEAADAERVMGMIHALGGTTRNDASEPWTIERVEPDALPDAPGFADDWNDGSPAEPELPAEPEPPGDETTDDPPAEDEVVDDPPLEDPPTPMPRPVGPLGRFGVFIPLTSSSPSQLAASDQLSAAPSLGIGLRGNAFLGPGRRISLGGELSLQPQLVSSQTQHRLSTGTAVIFVEYRHPVGSGGRFEIGGGGMIGMASQALVHDGDNPLPCSDGREASRRNGLWSGARFYFAALLGPRRNHEISLRAGPGLAAFSGGTPGGLMSEDVDCAMEPTAFETFGLDDGAALVMTFDIGYAPRF